MDDPATDGQSSLFGLNDEKTTFKLSPRAQSLLYFHHLESLHREVRALLRMTRVIGGDAEEDVLNQVKHVLKEGFKRA